MVTEVGRAKHLRSLSYARSLASPLSFKMHKSQCHLPLTLTLIFYHTQSYLTGFKWYKINDTGKTILDGKDLRHMILKIMDALSDYELDSEKGLGRAAKEMRKKLVEVSENMHLCMMS
jgi:hypothetical protein